MFPRTPLNSWWDDVPALCSTCIKGREVSPHSMQETPRHGMRTRPPLPTVRVTSDTTVWVMSDASCFCLVLAFRFLFVLFVSLHGSCNVRNDGVHNVRRTLFLFVFVWFVLFLLSLHWRRGGEPLPILCGGTPPPWHLPLPMVRVTSDTTLCVTLDASGGVSTSIHYGHTRHVRTTRGYRVANHHPPRRASHLCNVSLGDKSCEAHN